MYHPPQDQFRPRPEYDEVMRHYAGEARRFRRPALSDRLAIVLMLLIAVVAWVGIWTNEFPPSRGDNPGGEPQAPRLNPSDGEQQ